MKRLWILLFVMACGDSTGPADDCVNVLRQGVATNTVTGAVDLVWLDVKVCTERTSYLLPSAYASDEWDVSLLDPNAPTTGSITIIVCLDGICPDGTVIVSPPRRLADTIATVIRGTSGARP
jgi:hypothetical protein